MKTMRTVILFSVLLCCACAEEDELQLATDLICEELDFQSCGGDLVGAWSVTSSCSETQVTTPLLSGCPESTLEREIGPAGTLVFNEDSTLQASLSIRTRTRFSLPKACLSELAESGQVPECSEITPPENFQFCVDREDHCLCSASEVSSVFSGVSETMQGLEARRQPFSVEEDQRFVIQETGRSFEYCVEGRFLTMRWVEEFQNGDNIFTMRLLRP